jgi:hypothetical protein
MACLTIGNNHEVFWFETIPADRSRIGGKMSFWQKNCTLAMLRRIRLGQILSDTSQGAPEHAQVSPALAQG